MIMIRSLTFIIVLLIISAAVVVADEQKFGGIGLQVVPTINGNLVVLNVLPDSPAAVSGMKPGDLIFQVDEFNLLNSDFGKVVSEHLWGRVDTSVTLHYRRPGRAGDFRADIVRAQIDPRLTVTPVVQEQAEGAVGGE